MVARKISNNEQFQHEKSQNNNLNSQFCWLDDMMAMVRNGGGEVQALQPSEQQQNLPFRLGQRRWVYRGEGNANIVIALPDDRQILRLRKSEERVDEQSERTVYEQIEREVSYCNELMAPLLGRDYVQPALGVTLDPEEVKELDRKLLNMRPAHRRHKRLRVNRGTIYPDYTYLPAALSAKRANSVFCVEVKPKQGWIPCGQRIPPKCTFCLNQFLKLKQQKAASLSDYCPLDLFSGNRERMMNALQALLRSPQNNLRIFKDGLLVFGEELEGDVLPVLREWFSCTDLTNEDPVEPERDERTRLMRNFCHVMIEGLTRNLLDAGANNFDASKNELPVATIRHLAASPLEKEWSWSPFNVEPTSVDNIPACDGRCEPMPDDCILDRILTLQKFGHRSAEPVYRIYKSIHENKSLFPSADLSSILNGIKQHEPRPASDWLTLQLYLLAATAKDCSILIAFQPFHEKRSQQDEVPSKYLIKDLEGNCHVFSVGVVDLDPKPLNCIEKHRARDQNMLQAFCEYTKLPANV